MSQEKPDRKKPGPKPRFAEPMGKTSMFLPARLIDWAKDEPGGMAELVRRLLQEEYDRRDG